MAKNRKLYVAKQAKKNEFYTQLSDIENELRYYQGHFKGKVVYCNCDDPRVSNFFKYFSLKFEHLGLKKLITTCYRNQQPDLFSKHDSERAVYLEYEGDQDGNRRPDHHEIAVKHLNGDGNFSSAECIELLKEADIVVTNPPFSPFRDYVAQLVKYDKKFLIIGNKNAITYKEIFPLIKENKIWSGVSRWAGGMLFDVPDDHAKWLIKTGKEGSNYKFVNGVVKALSPSIWFTNLPHKKRNEELILYKKYSPEEYPKYDNYDAINVNKTAYIPADYDGVMGVPITFLEKYNPEQFEILGIANSARWIGYECLTIIEGRRIYNRIIIRNKQL
ncbi:MAG: adenine-specific methyltransferase EcoRI family protein [Bacteroidetes bacterium]|nr:adenine-specific methyltransferase EcoRI family protein [Bacteroidota bacterium]